MAVPIINQIDWKTFEHRDLMARNWRAGIFEWGLLYKEIYKISIYPNYTRKYESEPYWSPTHAGGLFAIDRNWFNELGIYDTGIKVWYVITYHIYTLFLIKPTQ
jgi:polypeptide N-acetylgalactosaminyltransferase